jgi:hypothetical protein
MNHDDEEPASPEELAAAARLAAELDGIADANHTAGMIRAASGNAAPLGELRARALARSALQPRRRPRWWRAVAVLAAAALVLLWVGLRRDPLPSQLEARSAGLLVPGPFPASQTAAQRLDLVAADRLIALREARVRAFSRGSR